MAFFAGFKPETVAIPNGQMRLRRGGNGPPLLLLHGNPQTHAMWHAVAPKLAQDFTVYCPDLRGYGGSHKPGLSSDHMAYSKREMAGDMIQLMDHFGHKVFTVISHDRGARVAHRMALDHPTRIDKLAIMDIVPTIEHFERTSMAFATAYSHWFYLIQPAPIPENMINPDPVQWFHGHTRRDPKGHDFFHPEALADYLQAVKNPAMIQAMCEDYRAAATIDMDHDRESREKGRKIQCPLLALWGDKGIIGRFYDPLVLWQSYADAPVTGGSVSAGHYLAEEAPDQVLNHLSVFLR